MAFTLLVAVVFALGFLTGPARSDDSASYVLPLTGSAGGGNTFPGVSVPFGMVKLGPDMDTGPPGGTDGYSGYLPGDAFFTGFSMLHESGTGGAPKYGVVSQMPVLGDTVANPLARQADARSSAVPDTASLGSYTATLASGIVVSLAASSRAGLVQYSFPNNASANNGSSSVIVDVSHVLQLDSRKAWSQTYLGGSINTSVLPDGSGLQYQGSGTYGNGWNLSPPWTVYFCGFFDRPGTVSTFVGVDGTSNTIAQYSAATAVPSTTARVGAVFSFNGTSSTSSMSTVISRIGVSFISTDQACSNVNTLVPAGTTHEVLANQTRDAWTDQVLSRVTTTDTSNTTRLQLLYTSLYHMFLLPQNKTGENPRWASSEPYFDDLFTLWDLFRCTTPLWHILQPTMYEELVRSLVDIWRHDGFLPDGRSSFSNGAIQGGTNADNVLADAFVKGVRGLVNWNDGFSAMKTNAEVVPPNNHDPRDTTGSTLQGRGALPDWLRYGLVTQKYGRSVSRAVEYSTNDFALYQVASGLNKTSDAATYLKRSRNWRNHWNPNAKSLGFSGFMMPRTPAAFIMQDPLSCGGCYWGDDYYEALPWEYSFNAHHDLSTLIDYSGGEATFQQRLDTMFVPGLRPSGSEPFGNMIFNPGNEPSFTTPFLFNYIDRQDLTVRYSRYIADSYYQPTPTGLPGNSDAGAMESWLLWSMLGLYPITGQTTFLIGSPWFDDLTIGLGGPGSANVLHITTTTASGESASAQGSSCIYVQSLRINGQPWTKSWLTYDDIFASGGTMDFVLGSEPVNWTSPGNPPPSPAAGGKASETLGTNGKLPMMRHNLSMKEKTVVASISATIGTACIALSFFIVQHRRRSQKARKTSHQLGNQPDSVETGSTMTDRTALGNAETDSTLTAVSGQKLWRRLTGLQISKMAKMPKILELFKKPRMLKKPKTPKTIKILGVPNIRTPRPSFMSRQQTLTEIEPQIQQLQQPVQSVRSPPTVGARTRADSTNSTLVERDEHPEQQTEGPQNVLQELKETT